MTIISASIDDETLRQLSSLSKSIKFSSRSDAIRAGIRSLASEHRLIEKLSGKINAVLLLVHAESAEAKAVPLKHDFGDIIGTQIHSNLKDGKCLELFMLAGEASRIKKMHELALSNKKMGQVRLIVP